MQPERESSHFLLSLERTRSSAARAAPLWPRAEEFTTRQVVTNTPEDVMAAISSGVCGRSKNRCASPSIPAAIGLLGRSSSRHVGDGHLAIAVCFLHGRTGGSHRFISSSLRRESNNWKARSTPTARTVESRLPATASPELRASVKRAARRVAPRKAIPAIPWR